jgi:3-methyladenine DNA glycosylase AlkD
MMSSRPAADLLKRTLRRLDELADPEHSSGAAQFFREPIHARGVRSPELIALSADLYREIKAWPVRSRDELVTGLWKDSHIETGALACYLYRRFAKSFGEREFRLFERWLDQYATNWSHCDGLSVYLLAPAIAHVPELAPELIPWTKSRNRWKRRAAAVALVKEAKHGRHLQLIFEIAAALAHDPEDLVEKGAGWLLKETYPARPREVVEFLKVRGKGWPRLVLRYAAEKMTPRDKHAVLSWEN